MTLRFRSDSKRVSSAGGPERAAWGERREMTSITPTTWGAPWPKQRHKYRASAPAVEDTRYPISHLRRTHSLPERNGGFAIASAERFDVTNAARTLC